MQPMFRKPGSLRCYLPLYFFFLVELGHDCFMQPVPSCDECRLRLVAVHGLLTEVASFVLSTSFSSCGM